MSQTSTRAILAASPVAPYYRPLFDLTGNINATLALSQAIAWCSSAKKFPVTAPPEDHFYASPQDWADSLGLDLCDVGEVVLTLQRYGFAKVEYPDAGEPVATARCRWKLDFGKIEAALKTGLPWVRKGGEKE